MESKPGGFQINVNEIMALKMVPLLFLPMPWLRLVVKQAPLFGDPTSGTSPLCAAVKLP
jgi:hypothetical protein